MSARARSLLSERHSWERPALAELGRSQAYAACRTRKLAHPWPRTFAVLVFLVAATSAFAQPADMSDEAGLVDRLEAIGKQIAKAEQERAQRKGAVDVAVAELRKVDKEIGDRKASLKRLAENMALEEARLIELQAESARLETDLSGEKSALAALLRSAYVLGRLDTLKLILAQDQMSDTGRLMAYSTQLQRVRMSRIGRVRELLAGLASVLADTETARKTLAALRALEEQTLAELDQDRARRGAIVKELKSALAKVEARVEDLGRDQQEIESLLAQLRDVIGDVPALLPQDRPFAESRGSLGRPLAGRTSIGFGQAGPGGRASAGTIILAARGTPIKAVARGRVAFADWLRGYGLLLILDHGDGYMSLYGRCETLDKAEGDWVEAGAPLATVGDSGGAAEPGLYFELRHRGQALDPGQWWQK